VIAQAPPLQHPIQARHQMALLAGKSLAVTAPDFDLARLTVPLMLVSLPRNRSATSLTSSEADLAAPPRRSSGGGRVKLNIRPPPS
jgi:hypothetical protein